MFHAAAYKHVPMMERNPLEAIKTNVLGTKILAEAADRWGAQAFVLVSTDKAVEPVCVMGASKRMAELTIQALAGRSRTRFLCVRFGNVLGTSGSVIPVFREQIERGGLGVFGHRIAAPGLAHQALGVGAIAAREQHPRQREAALGR